MTKTIETLTAEQATGCNENPSGLGKAYSDSGVELTAQRAREDLSDGKTIELPNTGAGSYRKVFCELSSFQDVRVIDHTSSAGDWCFGVFDGQEWRRAFQENRYPYHGFRYSVDATFSTETFEELSVAS